MVNPTIPRGEYLFSVPKAIENFYGMILSDVSGGGQNDTLIAETFDEDWSLRPNGFNPVEGTGPGRNSVKGVAGLYVQAIPDLKFERMQTLLCGDRVAVLSKVSIFHYINYKSIMRADDQAHEKIFE